MIEILNELKYRGWILNQIFTNIIFLAIHTVVGLLHFSLSSYRLVYQVSDRLSKLIAQYCSVYIILNKNMFNIFFVILNEKW